MGYEDVAWIQQTPKSLAETYENEYGDDEILKCFRIIRHWLWFTDFIPVNYCTPTEKKVSFLSKEAALLKDAPSPEIHQYKRVKNFRLGRIDIPFFKYLWFRASCFIVVK